MTKPKPKTNEPIRLSDQSVPLRQRIRLAYQPGMSIADLQKKVRSPVEKIIDAVGKLRRRGEITCDVPHNRAGHALRAANRGRLVTAADRADFDRTIPPDMLAQIEERVRAGVITHCDPGPRCVSFPQKAVRLPLAMES